MSAGYWQAVPPGQAVGAAVDPEVRLARAYLLRVAEPPAPALAALVDECGPVRSAALVRQGRVPPAVLAETQARRCVDRAAADLLAAAALEARLVVPEDDEWPAWPFAAFGPAAARGVDWAVAPLGLWVRGPARLDELSASAVAVVGARAATSYGEHVASEFGYGLAERGVAVVSGAAYGIDGAAHRGALAAGGPTFAVLGCGVDYGYPSGHVGLLREIARDGAVVSEYPPGTPPARHRFLVRNRLIAALSDGTVVVEAGARSGARNTAGAAAQLGRVVMAVPGPVTSAMSRGCNTLIRDGAAFLVDGVQQVIEAVGPLKADLDSPATEPPRATDGLDPLELRVHEALRARAARSPAWLAREAGVPLDRVRAVLPMLEHRGMAERCEAGWRLASRRDHRPGTHGASPSSEDGSRGE
jgi:DNA processing protein